MGRSNDARLRHGRAKPPRPRAHATHAAPPLVEPLERRLLLSAVSLFADARAFSFLDADGDEVTVRLLGPGVARLLFNADENGRADLDRVEIVGGSHKTQLHMRVHAADGTHGATTLGSVNADAVGTLRLDGVRVTGDSDLGDGLREFRADALDEGASLRAFAHAKGARIDLIAAASGTTIDVFGALNSVHIGEGAAAHVRADTLGDVRIDGPAHGMTLVSHTTIGHVHIGGEARGVTVAATQTIGVFFVDGPLVDSTVLAGTTLGRSISFEGAAFGVGAIDVAHIRGDVTDSIIAAGGHPGADLLFHDGDILRGGVIGRLVIDGYVEGYDSHHANPGIYAAHIEALHVAGYDLSGKHEAAHVATRGSAVIDPLPSAANALTVADIERIFELTVAQARALGVNATIALVDREGNILGAIRMTDGAFPAASLTTTIHGGGAGGLEGVTVPSAMAAATKAGTAAYLSSQGNAFTTRTAGQIIQPNFPPGVKNRASGPLFGVQFSNLPTSDVNALPLGLAADPGGLPLYRGGQVVAGIGVELDGVYTASLTNKKSKATMEEQIALAGQIGFEAPKKITADRIFVEGVRLLYAFGNPIKLKKLEKAGPIESYASLEGGGALTELVSPRVSPATMFTTVGLGGRLGETVPHLAASRYTAVTAAEGFLFAARDRADLTTDVVRINVNTGVQTTLFTVGAVGASPLDPGERVLSLAYDDAGTPGATGDDAVYVMSEQGRVVRFPVGAGAPSAPATIANANALLRDAVFFEDGGSPTMIGISAVTGQLFKVGLTDVTSPASFTALTTAAAGRVQSFAFGPAGLFAVREMGDARQLVRVQSNGGGFVVVNTLSSPGSAEARPGNRLGALAYDDRGTADPLDDVLIVQNNTTGVQFTVATTNGAVTVGAQTIATPLASLQQARVVASGPNTFVLGVSAQSDRVYRINAASPDNPASVTELTPSDAGAAITRAGRANTAGDFLTQAEVSNILRQAHDLNAMLRAQIRKDRPQVSQVTVSVVDAAGNLLGVFRTPDAPVFGFDTSVQKARTAAFMSRVDAGAILETAEGGAFAQFVNGARALGVDLDGTVAISDRAGGFLARPFLPDGIPNTGPGPFSAQSPGVFSVFNTGMQTRLLLTNLVSYLQEFASVGDHGAALSFFDAGLIGGRGVTDASIAMSNGMQIFPGSVPLYRNGVLIGAVGVSGDGIEQDDFVAFAGSEGFREFGTVMRADEVTINNGGKSFRLPYLKFPRSPFGGF